MWALGVVLGSNFCSTVRQTRTVGATVTKTSWESRRAWERRRCNCCSMATVEYAATIQLFQTTTLFIFQIQSENNARAPRNPPLVWTTTSLSHQSISYVIPGQISTSGLRPQWCKTRAPDLSRQVHNQRDMQIWHILNRGKGEINRTYDTMQVQNLNLLRILLALPCLCGQELER
jgi:hypothetical protein